MNDVLVAGVTVGAGAGAAALVIVVLLVPGLLLPNIEAAAPNTGAQTGCVPNDGIVALDVVTTLDPKLKVGPT